jgi:homoserine O-succinyltransferase/O-acetyltransferase
MALTIEHASPTGVAQLGNIREQHLRRGATRDRGKRIEIGLVNNMPDAALLATERQFCDLLESACGDADVRLHLYALPDVPRSDEARAGLMRNYRDAGRLRGERLDALIVTGAEPLAPELAQEPYWRSLCDLINWAETNTVSTILSCLAAHVGVQHLDGIARQPLPAKCSGIFAFETVARHKLVSDLASGVLAPHSRRNGLSRQDLAGHGYQTLTYDSEIGVDIFVKQTQSLFVFLQGHPEYETDSLAREYRRDMNRFLRGERDALPGIPAGYFPPLVERSLAIFAERARLQRRPDLMAAFPDAGAVGPGKAPWRRSAIQLYRNWLDIVAERKAGLLDDAPIAVARWGG